MPSTPTPDLHRRRSLAAPDAVAQHTFMLPVVRPLPPPMISALVDANAW